MKRINLYILTIVIIGMISSCYYDNKEEQYPYLYSNCDTTVFSFSEAVKPILQTNCLECHGNNTASITGSGIFLEDYSDVKALGENGVLFGAVSHAPGYSPMPKDRGKLDDCSIIIIKKWIDEGFPEN